MPPRCDTAGVLPAVIDFYDQVISRQLLLQGGMTAEAIRHRLRTRQWQELLPGSYLTHRGEPSRRQKLIAALFYAGPESAIDDVDACRFHGMRAASADDDLVRVVSPKSQPVRTFGFVVVRRTIAPIQVISTDRLRYVDPAAAAIAVARRQRSERRVLAILSDVLQRRITSYDSLVRAHVQGSPRNSRLTDGVMEQLGAGVRSAPEGDFRNLAQASTVLPELKYNAWLRLPDKKLVCVDALAVSSAVLHETNGRIAHRRDDLFEDLQVRHDNLTGWGLTAFHNTPSRIRRSGREVIVEVERAHLRYDGRGLPPGVELLRECEIPGF